MRNNWGKISENTSNYFFRSSRSQFAVIGDDLLVQLRQILEEEPRQGESRVFTMARNVYKVRIVEKCFLLLALDIFPPVSRLMSNKMSV